MRISASSPHSMHRDSPLTYENDTEEGRKPEGGFLGEGHVAKWRVTLNFHTSTSHGYYRDITTTHECQAGPRVGFLKEWRVGDRPRFIRMLMELGRGEIDGSGTVVNGENLRVELWFFFSSDVGSCNATDMSVQRF